MIITVVLVLSFFLIAFVTAEVLFRTGQAGVLVLAIAFGFHNFRPGELPRLPFYLLTNAAATILTIVTVILSMVIS